MAKRNFFEEFVQNDFFEKKASENEHIKDALGGVTPSVLEKLAEEIGALCDEDQTMTLEQKLASEDVAPEKEEEKEKKEGACSKSAEDEETKDESKEEPKKEEVTEDKAAEDNEKVEDCKKDSKSEKEDVTEDKEAECDSEEKSEDDSKEQSTEDKKEAGDCEQGSEDKKEEPKEDKEAECEADKDNSDEDKELTKKAYELAEQKLAEQGYSVADYVFRKTANESVTEFITEYAEKLASLSERPILQVADEIINSVFEKLG